MNKLKVHELRQEVKNRNIPLPSGYVKKTELVRLLASTEDTVTRKALVVGKNAPGVMRFEMCLVGKDVDWFKLTVEKVYRNTFSALFIMDISMMVTVGGEVNPRTFSAILNSLTENHKIYLKRETSVESGKIINTLRAKGYRVKVSALQTFNEWTLAPPSKMTKTRKTKKESQHLQRRERSYTTLSSLPENSGNFSITVGQFREEIQNSKTIESFLNSQMDMLQYKKETYEKLLTDIKKETTLLEQKIKMLSNAGVYSSRIEEICPMYVFYVGFQMDIKQLIEQCDQRLKDLSFKSVKVGLDKAVNDPELGLASLVGRTDVKNQIVAVLYSFAKSFRSFVNSFHNMVIMGPSGVGKTALAKVIAFVFSQAGMLITDNVRIVSRADVVGQYIGQTAPLMRSHLMRGLDGVLFVDEAYQLASQSDKDYGSEAITELVNFTDKYIGLGVIIVAGYEQAMVERFFPTNEGLMRRFPYRYTLSEYSPQHLTDILISVMEKCSGVRVEQDVANLLFTVVDKYNTEGVLDRQAGDMLNLGACIVRAVNSSYGVAVGDGVIMNGVQEFLDMKATASLRGEKQ